MKTVDSIWKLFMILFNFEAYHCTHTRISYSNNQWTKCTQNSMSKQRKKSMTKKKVNISLDDMKKGKGGGERTLLMMTMITFLRVVELVFIASLVEKENGKCWSDMDFEELGYGWRRMYTHCHCQRAFLFSFFHLACVIRIICKHVEVLMRWRHVCIHNRSNTVQKAAAIQFYTYTWSSCLLNQMEFVLFFFSTSVQ